MFKKYLGNVVLISGRSVFKTNKQIPFFEPFKNNFCSFHTGDIKQKNIPIFFLKHPIVWSKGFSNTTFIQMIWIHGRTDRQTNGRTDRLSDTTFILSLFSILSCLPSDSLCTRAVYALTTEPPSLRYWCSNIWDIYKGWRIRSRKNSHVINYCHSDPALNKLYLPVLSIPVKYYCYIH